MMRTLLLSSLSVCSIVAAKPQSSAGPELLGILLDQRPARIVPGVGASVMQDLSFRAAVTFEARWSYPYRIDHDHMTGNLRQLSTGDTARTHHVGYARYSALSGAIGYQRAVAGHARSTREWNWSMAFGWSADRTYYVDDHTRVFTGVSGHVETVRIDRYILGRVGAGFSMFVGRRGILHYRLTSDWRRPAGEASGERARIRHCDVALAVGYAWRW